ncbi:MAG: hypothetical protein JRH11_24430 [Deltaproteobacteria bacterium]|nr:hypothetical protein [Deltaproteobacteria bacterium]
MTAFVFAAALASGCGEEPRAHEVESSPYPHEWIVAGDVLDPDLREPGRVAVAYAQRVFRGTGTHRELELPGASDALRRYLYLGKVPPVRAGGSIPSRIGLQSLAGKGPGGSSGLSVFASVRPGITASNDVGATVVLWLAFDDGSTALAKVALRPLELIDVEDGPSYAFHPDWAVVPPPEGPR